MQQRVWPPGQFADERFPLAKQPCTEQVVDAPVVHPEYDAFVERCWITDSLEDKLASYPVVRYSEGVSKDPSAESDDIV